MLIPQAVVQEATQGMTLIETQTRGSTGTIDFLSIPQTYTHLCIKAFLRSAQANTTEALRVRFNNDSATACVGSYMQDANATITGQIDAATTAIACGTITGNSADANRFGAVVIDIPNYTSTSFHKSITVQVTGTYSTTAASGMVTSGGGVWPSTSAITRIRLWTGSGAGDWLTGSTASLYGIP